MLIPGLVFVAQYLLFWLLVGGWILYNTLRGIVGGGATDLAITWIALDRLPGADGALAGLGRGGVARDTVVLQVTDEAGLVQQFIAFERQHGVHLGCGLRPERHVHAVMALAAAGLDQVDAGELLVEVDDLVLSQFVERHLHHADCSADDLPARRDDGRGLLATQHRIGDFGGVRKMRNASFDNGYARRRQPVLNLFAKGVRHLHGITSQRDSACVVLMLLIGASPLMKATATSPSGWT